MMLSKRGFLFAGAALLASPIKAQAGDTLVIAATTSMEDSGLANFIGERYLAASGVALQFISAASETAASLASKGAATVLIVNHSGVAANLMKARLAQSVSEFMRNDFALVGPKADPANVRKQGSASAAFRAIASAKAPFISRGDRSGTHAAEMRIWDLAGIFPLSRPGYVQSGMGMRRALDLAVAENAYILTDRATWLAMPGHGNLDILLDSDPQLVNHYYVVLMSPEVISRSDMKAEKAFVEWLTTAPGQRAIQEFRMGAEAAFRPVTTF